MQLLWMGIPGVIVNHPVLEIAGFVCGAFITSDALRMLFHYGSFDFLAQLVLGLALGWGIVSMGRTLRKYHPFCIYHARRFLKSASNSEIPIRNDHSTEDAACEDTDLTKRLLD